MSTRKPKIPDPAFPVPTFAQGFSKDELAATVITAGICAGPYGEQIMTSSDPLKFDEVAEAALVLFGKVLERIAARHA